jgi:hypothetical protein
MRKRDPTYHSSFTDGYQLNIVHIVVKDKYIYNKVKYGRVLLCNLSPLYKNPIRNAQYITCIK